MGFIKNRLPDIETVLNREGHSGWRFKQMVLPSSRLGESDSMVAILERPAD